MRKLLRILALLLLPLLAAATHQVSGYITFRHMHGLTYQVTLINYTNGTPNNDPTACSTDADRDTMRINYGDGTSDVLIRYNGKPDPAGYPGGEQICTCRKLNLYTNSPDGVTGGHTFPGNGSYHMWIDDQDRMTGIINLPGSVNEDFYLFTTINIGLAGDSISSPATIGPKDNPPVCQYACSGQCYYYNLGMFSAEGDSISYSLGNCMISAGTQPNYGMIANDYTIPPGSTIDSNGTLSWCDPPAGSCSFPGCIYNFSIRVVSYKKVNISGTTYNFPIDTMDCEVEIIVNATCNAYPPKIIGPSDTCIVAGTLLNMKYDITDSDGSVLTVNATGQPFSLSPPASFTSSSVNPTIGNFSWQTNCSDIRSAPYTVTVMATDNNPPGLSSYYSTNIHVVAPAPTNLTAKVLGNSVYLHWNPSICPGATGYRIYRATGCIKFTPGYCETGVPPSSGYTYLGSTNNIDSVSYTDYNVVPGINYSYLVVASYPLPDGSLSYASNDTCVLVRRDLPLLTNVSVDSTSASTGKIFIRWVKPLADSGYLDTVALAPPYTYKLWRAVGMNSTTFTTLLLTRTVPFFGTQVDTTYRDTLLNTEYNSYKYRLDFYYHDTVPIGSSSSPPASSIYLTTKPGNRIMKLSWASNVPWTDSAYVIFRKMGSTFDSLTTVAGTVHAYTDSILTNGRNYCYYVKSKSFYADPTILHPLFDSSEIQCSSPKDTVPPCAPSLAVSPQCKLFEDSLVWNNPDHFCAGIYNDIKYYNIYYGATLSSDMQLLTTVTNVNDTIFVNANLTSVAGCYAVTAVDSFGNESVINKVCVDNCPQYTLPNVFSPNGDGLNDLFTPILPFRYIKSVDITIYNRWGQVMFHTLNPMINWDGTDQTTHGECPDGVYYYICVVNEIRVEGVQPITLKGFVQIIR